jgi:hypothetical protein
MRLSKKRKAIYLFLLLGVGAVGCVLSLLHYRAIFCFAFLLFALLFVTVLLIPLAQPPRCPHCSADLLDNISGRCPQCGQEV